MPPSIATTSRPADGCCWTWRPRRAAGSASSRRTDDWLALVPFWAVWPFETLLVARAAGRAPGGPRRRPARRARASVLQRLMRRYDGLFEQPMPFSMGWHQAPYQPGPADHWQVHAHFMPPLLEATKRKFMVGYELLSEPQRDITAGGGRRAPAGRADLRSRSPTRMEPALPQRTREGAAAAYHRPMADATVTTPTPMTARAAALARLADEDWDVVVIGGGIVGSGVLLDVGLAGPAGGPRGAGRPGRGHLVALLAPHPRWRPLPRGHAPPAGARGTRGALPADDPGPAPGAPGALPLPGLRLAGRASRHVQRRPDALRPAGRRA